MRGWAAGLGLIVALATGCSTDRGDPFVAVQPAGESVATLGPSPDAAPTDEGAPTPSTPPSTTIVAAVVPDTEVAPSAPAAGLVSVDPSALYGQTVDATVACLDVPTACDPSTVVVADSPAAARFTKLVDTLARAGYVVRHLPDVSHWNVESSEAGADGELSVVLCDVDGDIVIEPAAVSGVGQDVIVNDLVVARRVRVELRLTSAGWRRWSIEQLGEWPMESACAAA